MKKIELFLAAVLIAAGSSLTNCARSDKSDEGALQHDTRARAELKKDSAEEYKMLKAEWMVQLAANEKTLAELNVKITREEEQVQLKYQAELEALREKNTEVKEKINAIPPPDRTRWETLKKDLNSTMAKLAADLSRLGTAILEVGEK
jgi:uncharacterized coiled-coil protein SlyX